MKQGELLQQQNVKPSNIITQTPNKELTPKQQLIFKIQQCKDKFTQALPANITSDQYLRIVYNAINDNPKLQECEISSFISAVLKTASLGLEINNTSGEAYIIPYKTFNKETKNWEYKAQLQLGYRGLLKLAYSSHLIKDIFASDVHQNDNFRCIYGTKRVLYHEINCINDRGPVRGYYAEIRLNNGGDLFYYMKKEEMDEYKMKFASSTDTYSPWNRFYDEMAKKTVLRKVLKIAPLNHNVAIGVGVDNMVGLEEGKMQYMTTENKSTANATKKEEPKKVITTETKKRS